ncbi:MAG TPA: hypothetical protein PKH79_04865 [Prolixibacteraceae bacterium]|nr:hypothetical protein [Prolixibacteraceae bacterium]
MLESDDIFEEIKGAINRIPDNYKILEETIDIDVQKEFFESSKGIAIDPDTDLIPEMIARLNERDTTFEECKVLLQKLAFIDSVDAFRAIERYTKDPRPELKDWSVLSLQQSRMVLQCSLLDEQQVFISTGLGGKNNKLRYYFIFPYNQPEQTLTKIQEDLLVNELAFFMSKHEGEVEFTEFGKRYATSMILIPLKAPIPDIIREVLNECNQYGNFLSSDVMVTNMKKLGNEEILRIIDHYEVPEPF